ncbi:alpha/beta hydrolase [Paenibacillus puerhi]|uniref:alpha/beta hydrolase n=1 Tax=Paenibacillus puerhi TaxID=2692622 RepID=UPI00135B8D78|nr:alpha/beta hydrolase [Paenibacillus puerhi]
MEKTSLDQLMAIKSHLKQTSHYATQSTEQIRQDLAAAATRFPQLPYTRIEQTSFGQLTGEWVSDASRLPVSEKRVILYFHGGGFIAGTCEFYRDLAARVAKASGVKVLTFEYRLAPEHRYPAANEDAMHVYRQLLEEGYSARHMVFGGDSVGATLALMTLLTLRDAGEELPAGAFLLSPHTDLVHLDGESYQSRAELDPTGSKQSSERILADYLGGWSGEFPSLLSPLRLELKNLPRLLIQVGDHEVLLSDAIRLAERARAAGVDVSLEVWEQMWSVFQGLAYLLPEARQAIDHIGRFVQSCLDSEPC